MPRYTYTAKLNPRKTIQGDIEAESQQEAINKLTKIGYFPLSIKAEGLSPNKQNIFKKFKRFSNKEIVLFTNQLSTLIESGVNIIKAVNIISNQTANKYLKSVLNEVTNRVKDGKSLSDSLSLHPDIFSNLYTSTIRTGESSGNLKDVLKRLSDFYEKEEEFKNSLRSSLTYPFFVLLVSVLTIFVLLIFVIPRITSMFEDMGQILPLSTRVLIAASDFFHRFWPALFAVIIVLIFLFKRLIKNQRGKLLWDGFKLKLKMLGPVILKTEISRLMRTLSLLLSSGIPITSALNKTIPTINNQVLKIEIEKLYSQINKGSSLSEALKNSKLFPDFVTSIIAIGEETGSLDKSLKRIAGDYELEVDRALKVLLRLLEPTIILVMGLIVGFIVLSMLLPIFQINLIVK